MVMKKQETFTDIEYSFRKKKTKRDGVLEPLPGPNHCFTADETIFILGGNKDLQKFLNL